ncbi:MAG: hypothetical protein WBG01_01545 [Bacteroidota bacterium]
MSEIGIRSGVQQIDALYPRIRRFLEQDLSEYNLLGTRVRGYRSPDSPSIWLRDHSDMLRGGKYWEKDLTSATDHFAETQTGPGWLYDYFSMTPEKTPCEQENWAKYVRVPVEPDVEYRFVKAVFLAWQATGDDRWLKRMLPRMEKALQYILTDEWRWDKKHKLVKRGYCIDTWDFDYTAGRHPWLNFQITDETFWGIMHGDNSGYYEAFQQMSLFYAYLGRRSSARKWAKFAEGFRRRANRLCFNGRFYRHHVPLVPVQIPGVDESEQLSLSNPMNINRGLATHSMAVKILGEYRRRGEEGKAFAEWFSIDPAFPDGIFGDKKLVAGAYCNGGIMPLVGGELARAAFEHGREEYAVKQLLRYEELTRNNESYLWYFPDGRHATAETSTSPEAMPTDGWGSSAMLYALVEGLAGVVDEQKLFRRVRLSPRWVAAESQEASVSVAYGPSGATFEYEYAHDPGRKTMELEIRGKADVSLHLLLPRGVRAKRVSIGGKGKGKKVDHLNRKVEESPYVDVEVPVKKRASVLVEYS